MKNILLKLGIILLFLVTLSKTVSAADFRTHLIIIIYEGGIRDTILNHITNPTQERPLNVNIGVRDTLIVVYLSDSTETTNCPANYFRDSIIAQKSVPPGPGPQGQLATNATAIGTVINNNTVSVRFVATATGDAQIQSKSDVLFGPGNEGYTFCGSGGASSLTATNNSSGTQLTVNILAGSLPIELRSQSLTQIVNTQNLQYSWLVATQLNNDFFTPELSLDGVNWKELEKIAGAGTTTEEMSYSVIIKNVSSGYAYVRLKQTDFDGTFAYSPTLSILVDEWTEKADLAITADVSGDYANIKSANWHNTEAEKFSVEVYDTRGTKVIECLNIPKESFDNLYQIQLPEAAGMYAIRILGSSGSEAYIGRAVKR